jgi:hypothetical protein
MKKGSSLERVKGQINKIWRFHVDGVSGESEGERKVEQQQLFLTCLE